MFSDRVSSSTHTNPLSRLKAALRDQQIELLDLTQSNPTVCDLIPPGVLASLHNPAILHYEPDCRGLLSTRQSLATFLGCPADRLFLSASTSEAYSWLFKLLCNPGEAILVPKPGYPLFEYLAGLESVRTRGYRLEYRHPAGWFVDLELLAEQLACPDIKALVLIHPNNPTGSYIHDTEREAIIELCSRHQVALIVDEVFLSYRLESAVEGHSFGTVDRGLCFCLNGLSKLLCLPQLKLGWIQLSGEASLIEDAASRLEIIADSYLSVSAAAMHALPVLLQAVPAFTRLVRQRLLKNLQTARFVFETPEAPFRLLHCEAGWTALLEVPRYLPEEDIALKLLAEAAVAVHPGYMFDCEHEGTLALSLLVQPDIFMTACIKIRNWFDQH